MEKKCRCGCGDSATTSTGWSWGHWRRGLKSSEETRRLQSDLKKGQTPWNKGVKLGHSWNYNPDREMMEELGRFKRAMRKMLTRLFNGSWSGTISDIEKTLGYTRSELKLHLESLWEPGMNWKNHGRGGWHIDHKRPVSSFPVGTSPMIVNALSNLQPLWERDNLSKGGKFE